MANFVAEFAPDDRKPGGFTFPVTSVTEEGAKRAATSMLRNHASYAGLTIKHSIWQRSGTAGVLVCRRSVDLYDQFDRHRGGGFLHIYKESA